MVIPIAFKVILLKIGGSILDNEIDTRSTLSQLKPLAENERYNFQVIIIPGGGRYALFLRYLDKKLGIGDDLSHWAAIYSMDFNGLKLKEKYKFLQITSNFNKLLELKKDSLRELDMYVFLPYDYLSEMDELPHSWEVTSDSIAIYLAHYLKLNECYLIKDIDGIFDKKGNLIKQMTTLKFESLRDNSGLYQFKKEKSKIKSSTPLDAYSLNLINTHKINCILLNGSHDKSNIKEYFQNPTKSSRKFTRIIPSYI